MEDPPLPGVQKESPSSEFISSYDYTLPRRLVVCLDGTWNKRDSGTNIYHLSNLIQEGRVRDKDGREWFQIIYYDEGVGTGLLDGITGGAFGIGLSGNVREAYDWLVEKYRDGDPDRPDDEIYVFGFSRGAFTARSLVGLISKCGLVRRGSPIPPAQLWEGYRILGRHFNPRNDTTPSKNWWELIFGRPPKPFQLVFALKREKWENQKDPALEPPKNRTDKLLIQWSRRIKIKCVGVFDTVGSMGLDALAIPWLRDKLAQFHDTQLSSLIVNGFHALAIDEHRANFTHIPWSRRVDSKLPEKQTEHGGKLEQRWFVGAHSNVGGGYENDMLSQFSLKWMIEECEKLGLKFRVIPPDLRDPWSVAAYPDWVPLLKSPPNHPGMASEPPQVRDSFSEIGKGMWSGIIRSKREYRRIAPPPEFQNGAFLRSINETLDQSVLDLLEREKTVSEPHYNPPNLWEYRQRTDKSLPKPRHRYVENKSFVIWVLIWFAWLSLVAWAISQRLGIETWYWAIVPVAALALDWLESKLNHVVTVEPDGAKAKLFNAIIMFAISVRIVIFLALLSGLVFVPLWLFKHRL